MKKLTITLSLLFCIGFISADAQMMGFRIGGGYGYGNPYRSRNYNQEQSYGDFTPSFIISLGYGFPNLDAGQFANSYNYYAGNASQSGPFNGSIDYRFSRRMAVGLLITNGTVNAPYYAYGGSAEPSFSGQLQNTAIMLDLINYLPVSDKNISPYLRTAIGANIWNENYTGSNGSPVNYTSSPSDLAYQVSFGSNFYITKKAGFFIEAGYGKYILNAGLSFKL